MSKRLLIFNFYLPSFVVLVLCGCTKLETTTSSNSTSSKPISGKHHFVDGYAPLSGTDNVQVVVEIPTGTAQKWEVNKSDGKLHWQIKDGQLRVVNYIGYPGNYGMVPRTLLSYKNGGDGDPLDVLVLGPPVERGRVISSKLIGVLNLLDGGEQDDKLIAVMDNTAFSHLNSIEELRQEFPGVLSIIETWFVNYKGPGKLEASGFSDAKKAKSILQEAIKTYQQDTATRSN